MRNVAGVTYRIDACIECGKHVRVRKCRWATFKFCSRRCGYRWHDKHGKVAITCKICLKSFSVISFREKTAKYCSRKCYYIGSRHRGKTWYKCKCCQQKFRGAASQKRVFCSRSCVSKNKFTRFNPKFPDSALIAMRRRGLVKKCSRCGYRKNPNILGVHHKDRNRRNNRIENLEVLCANCHSVEHAKHIVHAGKHN